MTIVLGTYRRDIGVCVAEAFRSCLIYSISSSSDLCFGFFLFLRTGEIGAGGEEKRTVASFTRVGEVGFRGSGTDSGNDASAARSFLKGRRSLSGVRTSFIDRFLVMPRFGVSSFFEGWRGGRVDGKTVGEGGAGS